jgi:hypothetical protein
MKFPKLGVQPEVKHASGERALLFAILERAILDLIGKGKGTSVSERIRFREDAEHWIERNDREGINSYEKICEALGIDKDWLRKEPTRSKILNYYRRSTEEIHKNGRKPHTSRKPHATA